jgi:lipopolysaccharide exporter
MSLKQKAINGTKWTSISTVSLVLMQVIQLVVLTRLLDSSAFGLMGMVLVIIGFAEAFMDMGISNAIIYRQDLTRERLSSLYWLNIFVGIILFGVIWLSIPLIVLLFDEPKLSELMPWVAFIFLITPIGQQFQALLQKELKFNLIAKIEILSSVISTTIAIFTACLGFGVFSLVWGQLANSTIKAILFSMLGWHLCRPRLYFNLSNLEGFLSFGLYQMGERVINYFNTRVDQIIIGRFLGANILGLYTLAFNIINLPSSKINPIINKVTFPLFSKMQTQHERLKFNYFKVLSLISLINFPIFFGLFVTAPVLIPTIFGEKWDSSVILVQILCGVGLLRSIGNPIGPLLMAKGRADLAFKFNAIKMITQIPGIMLGVYFDGIFGVSIVYLILQVFYTIGSYLFLIKGVLGPCLKPYIKSILPALLMSSTMAFFVWFIGNFISEFPNVTILIIQILSGILIYLIMILNTKNEFIIEIKQMVLKESQAT